MLGSFDGSRWDTLVHDFTVPAGTSSVTVQILSENSGLGQFRLLKPASLVWVVSTFGLVGEEPPTDEGCSPGYWKNHLDSWTDTGYSPDDVFDQVFGVQAFGDRTLLEVIEQGGGGLTALGRHAVAALLNAAHPDVEYPISEADVLGLVHDAITSGDAQRIERLKNRLDRLNNFGCPLN